MKKLFCLLLSACMFLGLFAQSVKSTGLTDSDVKNFAKNLPKIEAELNKLEIQFAGDVGFSDIAAYEKAADILLKFGVSGDNACEKINMICLCYGVATIDKTMADLDAESKAILQALGQDPAAQYRALINDKDFKIVEKNYDALAKALEAIE